MYYTWIAIWWFFWFYCFLCWYDTEIRVGRKKVPTKLVLFFGFLFAGLVPILALIMTIKIAKDKL